MWGCMFKILCFVITPILCKRNAIDTSFDSLGIKLDHTCSGLEAFTNEAGFNSIAHNLYCELECDYDPYLNCNPKDTTVTYNHRYLQFLIDKMDKNEFIELEEVWTEDDYYERVIDLLQLMAPLVFIPMLIIFMNLIHSGYARFLFACSMVVYVMVSYYYLIALWFTAITCMILMFDVKSQSTFMFGTVSIASSAVTVACFMLRDFVVQCILIAAVSVAVLMLLVKHSNARSAPESMLVLNTVIMMLLVQPVLTGVVGSRGAAGLHVQIIELVTNVILPKGNSNVSFLNNWFNTVILKRILVRHGVNVESMHSLIVVGVLSVSTFLIRAVLGWLAQMNRKDNMRKPDLVRGFKVYSVDLVMSPVNLLQLIYALMVGNKVRTAAVIYHITVVVFTCFEFYNAIDIFFFRIVLLVIVIFSGEHDMMKNGRYLNSDLCFDGVFAKSGALPWMDIDRLEELRKYVVKVTGNGKMGYGFLTDAGGERSKLFTVQHVMEMNADLVVRDEALLDGYVTKGASDDPVVLSKMTLSYKGSDVGVLAKTEVNDVSHLVIMNEDTLNCVTKFKIQNGDIWATVSLKRGDSGSPVFAVLSDGTMRYAGAVSRGTIGEPGNMISTVLGTVVKGSPGLGYDNTYVDVPMSSDESHGYKKIFNEIVKTLTENQKLRAEKAKADVSKNRKAKIKQKLIEGRRDVEKSLDLTDRDEATREEVLKAYDEGRIITFNAVRGSRRG